jgi:Flp pilus assembly protein TadD
MIKTNFLFTFLVAATALAFLPARMHAQTQGRGVGVYLKTEDGKPEFVKLYDKSYALVIGESDYTAGWPRLPGVMKDIEAVTRALEQQGFQVTVVKNADAPQLDKSFKEFIDTYGQGTDNRLLFYFAGHGHTIKQSYGEEMGYIVPVDAPNPERDRAGFQRKAVDMQVMETYARRIQSKHALFVFDSCFSGSVFALAGRAGVPASITYKTTRPVRQFITSGSADEVVPDDSIFRRQFIEAIEGEADSNNDSYVTAAELGEYLQDKVINYSKNTQHPQYGKIKNPNLDKGDFVFILPKSPAPPPAVVNNQPAQPTAPPVNTADGMAVELAFWTSIQNSADPEDFKEYLQKYPQGQFSGLAQRRLTALTRSAAPAATPAPKPTPTTTELVDLNKQIREAYNRSDYNSVITLATRAISLDPQDALAYARRGEVYRLRSQHDLALADLNKAVTFAPQDAFAYTSRGDVLRVKGQYDQALDDLNKALSIDPEYAFAYAHRGVVYYKKKLYDQALNDLTQALRFSPDYAWALRRRADVYRAKGDETSARADIKRADQLEKEKP